MAEELPLLELSIVSDGRCVLGFHNANDFPPTTKVSSLHIHKNTCNNDDMEEV